jgi:hypothetical protein
MYECGSNSRKNLENPSGLFVSDTQREIFTAGGTDGCTGAWGASCFIQGGSAKSTKRCRHVPKFAFKGLVHLLIDLESQIPNMKKGTIQGNEIYASE